MWVVFILKSTDTVNNMIFINPSWYLFNSQLAIQSTEYKLKKENLKYGKQKQERWVFHVFPILIFIILCHMNCCELLFPITCFHKTAINWHMPLVLGSEMKNLQGAGASAAT